ncbi:sulfite exporter TauE/SafE family protein [Oribacterium sp. WCC10]|uniref:sulfite exporter TauE/SafE family protein n=1 Tax=Oribacterium sp. WCC10 TaxID=1855343 RepID=UPI0008F2CFCB|nr:sulfite exporter TauE/SafE family protein [Oribacterium sp. WCC10]SFG63370.1 hypothetical protein SAMN05216356_11614 [Oribacterium sp. WCC10]
MLSTNYLYFFLDIFLAHIMHGVTGFAGTLLAMPFGLMLVGYPVAKPVLNILGLFSGIYVFLGNRKYVVWKELWKIVAIMSVGILAGICIKDMLLGKEKLLYLVLGIFVIAVSIQGLIKELMTGSGKKSGEVHSEEALEKERPDAETDSDINGTLKVDTESEAKKSDKGRAFSGLSCLLLPVAGVIHGIFVSGGPLLISYLAKRIPEKNQFRTTISTVWIFLNTLVLMDDLRSGYWDVKLMLTTVCAAPFLFGGLKIGSMLYKRMSQHTFMIVTFVLLLLMGIKLLF